MNELPTISQIIENLQKIKDEHGDLPVMAQDEGSSWPATIVLMDSIPYTGGPNKYVSIYY